MHLEACAYRKKVQYIASRICSALSAQFYPWPQRAELIIRKGDLMIWDELPINNDEWDYYKSLSTVVQVSDQQRETCLLAVQRPNRGWPVSVTRALRYNTPPSYIMAPLFS